jgi:hypothetical protein
MELNTQLFITFKNVRHNCGISNLDKTKELNIQAIIRFRNLHIIKELITQPIDDCKENYIGKWKSIFFECLTQKSHSEFSVTNKQMKNLCRHYKC